jgi:hypothetical protein
MVQMRMGSLNEAALFRVTALIPCRKKWQFPFLSCARKRGKALLLFFN